MEVSNVFSINSTKSKKHSPLLPSSLRLLLCGACGAGKTNLLFNMLLNDAWLDFESLIIVGQSLFQPEYILLRECLEAGLTKKESRECFAAKKMIFVGKREQKIKFAFYSSEHQLPNPEDLDKGKNLLVFDDCLMCNQNTIMKYFVQGRHKGCDMIYLTQSYFSLDRRLIRNNSNFIIFFSQPLKSVSHLHRDFCSEIPFEEFNELCKHIWKKDHSFLCVDLTSSITDGKFRENFEKFYFPKQLLRED